MRRYAAWLAQHHAEVFPKFEPYNAANSFLHKMKRNIWWDKLEGDLAQWVDFTDPKLDSSAVLQNMNLMSTTILSLDDGSARDDFLEIALRVALRFVARPSAWQSIANL